MKRKPKQRVTQAEFARYVSATDPRDVPLDRDQQSAYITHLLSELRHRDEEMAALRSRFLESMASRDRRELDLMVEFSLMEARESRAQQKVRDQDKEVLC